MEIEIRTKRAGELDGYATALTQAFGWPPVTEARLDRIRATVPMERAIVAVEGGRIVGTAAAFPFRMSVPGGDVPTAGITAVAVVPTHRRQGVLRRMMQSNAPATSAGMPFAFAKSLPVPSGSTPRGTPVPASSCATSLTVPSPPAATTTAGRCSAAIRARTNSAASSALPGDTISIP